MTTKSPEISSVLKFIDIQFTDKKGNTYNLLPEELITYESFYKRNTPSIYGNILVYDMRGISDCIDFKTSSVKVYYIDLFDNFFYRTFKIINISESYNNTNNKLYEFKLRDEISYFLDNLFISKSYNTSRTNSFLSIMKEYNLNELLVANNINLIHEDDNIIGNLVLNKNLSVLDFFEKEFNRIGFSLYQDKGNLYIKNKDNLIPGKLPVLPDVFSQIATNQIYKNRIYEFINKPIQKEELDKTPAQKSYYYDIKQKKMISINDSISSLNSELTLNKNTELFQETVGTKAKFQNRPDSSQQKNDIRDRFLNASKSKMVVNGYVENDINKIAEIELLGHKGSNTTIAEGNVVSSGRYVILSVTDKIIGDKMLQLIEIGRSDLGR